MSFVGRQHAGQDARLLVHDVVGSMTTKGSSPTWSRATDTAWPSPSGSPWRTIVDVGEVGDGAHLSQLLVLARLLQAAFQLEGPVEVVLQAALAPARDDQDVGDPVLGGFLDHVLDGRLVDERHHLLGLGLGGGEEPGAEAGGGDHGFLDRVSHPVVLPPFRCAPGRPADPGAGPVHLAVKR